MLDPRFVIFASLFNIVGSAVYAYKTFKGETKPNRVTWLLWMVIPMIAFFAELQEGVGLQSLMTFMIGFGPLLVFIASFLNKQSYWQMSKLDWTCGILSIVALVAWKVSGHGDVAIAFSLVADGLAGLPTLIKSWKEPQSEHYAPYLAGAISAGITLLTITNWTFANYAFPAYILCTGVGVAVIVRFQLGRVVAKFGWAG
ncbi:MAG: hypothetical protein WC028_10410 [Candidatus Obscuribacterales bacterium]